MLRSSFRFSFAKDPQEAGEQIDDIEEDGHTRVDSIVERTGKAEGPPPIIHDIDREQRRSDIVDERQLCDGRRHAEMESYDLPDTHEHECDKGGKKVAPPPLQQVRIKDADERHDDCHATGGKKGSKYDRCLVERDTWTHNGAKAGDDEQVAGKRQVPLIPPKRNKDTHERKYQPDCQKGAERRVPGQSLKGHQGAGREAQDRTARHCRRVSARAQGIFINATIPNWGSKLHDTLHCSRTMRRLGGPGHPNPTTRTTY